MTHLFSPVGVLPLTSKVRLWTPRCQSQKFCFAFALSFLCPFSWPLGGHVRGGSLVKPVRGGADWHGARSTGIDRLDVASGGRQHSLSFILWSILTTLTPTHLHQCSVSLVFISHRTPSGLGGMLHRIDDYSTIFGPNFASDGDFESQ